MNSRSTWIWLVIALGLAVFIFVVEPRLRPPPSLPQRVLPGFAAKGVTAVSIRPAEGPEIRIELTNGAWQLVKPIAYPAKGVAVEALLTTLETLMADATISGREVRERPNAPADYGIEPPQFSATFWERDTRHQLLFGARTAPGDQVFMQVVGREGIQIVSADILKQVPLVINAWRDTAMVELRSLSFNRITVSNAATVIELQVSPDQTWRMVRPRAQRANGDRIDQLLVNLVKMRASGFVTDDAGADLEAFGLQPPQASVTLSLGTNLNAALQFGLSPTNDPKLVYARRPRWPTVVTVERELLSPWLAPAADFRDRQLVALTRFPDRIEMSGEESFTLVRQSNSSWRLATQEFPVDNTAVVELVGALTNMTIAGFEDVVTDLDLPRFGLVPPERQITLFNTLTNGGGLTNVPYLSLMFGKQQDGRVNIRRSDEDSVYAVTGEVVGKIPTRAIQLRDRRLWSIPGNEVTRVTVRQAGQTRTLIHEGTNAWSLAPGSTGDVFGPAVEETVHRLGDLSALGWVDRGEAGLARCGFSTNSVSIQLELKNGSKVGVDFGGASPSGYPCAATTMQGEPWVFEIPIGVHYLVRTHLAILGGAP